MREITPQEIYEHKDRFVFVDVREPYELVGPEGKIEGVILATLGHKLIAFLETVLVIVPHVAELLLILVKYSEIKSSSLI